MLHHFLNSEFLPTAMQIVGMGLVTIFIPVVLALLQDLEDPWDKAVIFEKVVRVKTTLLGIALTFVPTFFWYLHCWRLFFFAVFVAGVWVLLWILNNCYGWLRTLPTGGQYDNLSYRNKLRVEYLTDKGNWEEKERIWSKTLAKKATDSRIEQDLTKQFTATIDALIEEGEYALVARYLRLFYEEREERMWVGWVIFSEIFSKVLQWHFLFEEKEERQLADTAAATDHYVFEVNAGVLQLLRALVRIGLDNAAHLFFEDLKKHISDKNPEYVQHLLVQAVCTGVFETGGGRERYDVWSDYFPAAWKTTPTTLNDRANYISKIWLDQFFQWAQRRIWDSKNFDSELDDVAAGLFPSIDPIWWSAILTLLMGPYGEEGRMKAWIKRQKNFGYASRVGIGSFGSPEEASKQLASMIDQQRQATVELAALLFRRDFSPEKIDQYIKELEAVEYEKESREEYRKKDYLQLLTALRGAAERVAAP